MFLKMNGSEKTFQKKNCESCGESFGCGAETEKCWCFELKLPAEALLEINSLYNGCLCPECLLRFGRNNSKIESELVQI